MKYIVPTVIRRLLLWGNVLLIAALIASAYLPRMHPGAFWPSGFAGLPFPFFWVLNLLFIPLLLLYYKRKYWIIPIVGLLLTIPACLVTWGFHLFGGSDARSERSFTIMSFNCSSMGLQSYKDRPDIRERIHKVLGEANPDILCLQEFYTNDKPGLRSNLDSIRKQLGYPYHYFVKNLTRWETWHFGTVMFSRFPIVDTARFELDGGEESEDMLTAKLLIHGDTVRILSAHLASYRLESSDYRTVRTPDNEKVKGLIGKMRRSLNLRAKQAAILRSEIDRTQMPVIVAGDFNDIPVSYTYNVIRGDLQDAFLKKGSGFGRTFSAISPTLRIDYILPDNHFTVEDFSILRRRGFDHFPVMARLSQTP